MNRRLAVFNYYPLEYMGGGENFAINLFNELMNDYTIHYFSPSNVKLNGRIKTQNLNELISFEYGKCAFQNYSIIKIAVLYKTFPSVEAMEGLDSIVIVLGSPVPRRYLRILVEKNKKVLFLVHGLTVERFSIRSFSSLKISVFQLWIRLNFAINRKFYTSEQFNFQVLNTSQANLLRRIGVREGGIFLIPNGISFSNYQVGEAFDKFRIVFIGRMEKLIKGTDFLLSVAERIFQANSEIEFNIIGSGKDESLVKRFAKKNSRLKYYSYVSDDLKRNVLTNASLMIVTSRVEPFSIALVEGLASGLPVLSTNSSGPMFILAQDPSFGRTIPHNSKEFASNILDYFSAWRSNRNFYYEQKKARRFNAERIFGSEKMIDSYRSLFAKIFGGNFE